MNPRSFFKTVIATLSTEIGIHLLNFVTIIFIVRQLSSTDFGIFSLFISFSLTLCYLSTIGLPQAIIFFIGKRTEPVEKIVSISLFLFFCIGTSVVTIGYLIKNIPLHSFLRELPYQYFLPLLVIYFFTLLDSFLLSIIRGLKNFLLFNLRRLLTPACNFLGILFVYLLLGLSLRSVVIVFTAVAVILTVLFFIKVILIAPLRPKIDLISIKSFTGYGIKSYLQILAGHLIYQIDLYIIAYLLGAKQVAFYGIAVGMATLLWYLPNTVGMVLFPTLASEDNEKDIHIFSALACRHTLVTTSVGAICLALIGKYLILLFYGAEYINSVNAMLIILPGVVVMSIYKVLTRNFSSRNRQQVSIMAATISLIVNICLNFAWIPKYGIEGAALASTISYILAGAILVFKVKLESDMPLRKILFVNASDIKPYVEAISKFQKRYLNLGS